MQTEKTTEQIGTSAVTPSWMSVIREHMSGPIFSLATHILILVLLGTLVVIAPKSQKEDDVPVQITEVEAVLPPPEEEPMPAEETIMDTSSPSLDRYDSNEQQQMEEVGVTDVQVVSDIEIPTPLTIPDNNSALKLQGVLPFGRPGGGGKMGDGGEGDGRGNLKGMLQGVFYDLKQTKDRRDTDAARGNHESIIPIVKEFVLGGWSRQNDNNGQVHYPYFDKYYCSPTRLWNSCFYIPIIAASEAPKAYQCANEVKEGGWVCIYSGNVIAPFTGKFRFVGIGDDVLLIRFNKKIVFDYGWYSYTMGVRLNGDFNSSLDGIRDAMAGGTPRSDAHRKLIQDSPFYSKHKLDVYFPNFDKNHGIAKGPVIDVTDGQVCSIEILISEIPGGSFNVVLFVEQLDENGEPLEKNPESLTLFRTTLDLPADPTNDFPKFKHYGPVWRTTRSNATSESDARLMAKRGSTRTERVSEDDDDLSL